MGNLQQIPDCRGFEREMRCVERARSGFVKGCEVFRRGDGYLLRKGCMGGCAGEVVRQVRRDAKRRASNLIQPKALASTVPGCALNPQLILYFDFYLETLAAELTKKPSMG